MKTKINQKSKIKLLTNTKQFRETLCDRCHRIFYRKLVPSKENGRQLTKINDITYWSGGKLWKDFRILCRLCLKTWFEKYPLDFADLVKEQSKKRTFHHYRHLNLLTAKKEIYKK
ncbi:hypothetical protein [endosymbiont GvMRE of Glomus versiforme]|uniref:hypothetical protein n=1 Tax=endosymbiont GvMRE of Glomus versiforme TaxID=2039283 RepID=UPI000EE5C9D3|nr:hypothetical protein [endosymbiont GvMRE of Glomus versiforme]RHZ37179.1 hypothetical protein GvMRE_I1g278 [endosymbiont GvMRE of Glomus versiforme]